MISTAISFPAPPKRTSPTRDYFCGWYFKCQSQTQTLAIIPAVHTHRGQRTCSIQIITEEGSWNIPLSSSGASMSRRKPYAVLEGSSFSPTGIHLAIHTEQVQAEGDLSFGTLSPIQYDIMGPFQFVPFLECRHRVVSMSHTVTGELRINHQNYTFQNGTGYLEGDQGRSFPRRYAWTECCFPEGAVMLSVADIPLGPVQFSGVIAVVQLKGREYRLATYLGAKPIQVQGGTIVVKQGDLQLTAQLLEPITHALHAPTSGQMTRTIRENVACHARYQLLQGSSVIWDLDSPKASFEYEYPN